MSPPQGNTGTPKPVAGARAAAEVLRAIHLQTAAQVKTHFSDRREVFEPLLDAIEAAADDIESAADDAWHENRHFEKTQGSDLGVSR